MPQIFCKNASVISHGALMRLNISSICIILSNGKMTFLACCCQIHAFFRGAQCDSMPSISSTVCCSCLSIVAFAIFSAYRYNSISIRSGVTTSKLSIRKFLGKPNFTSARHSIESWLSEHSQHSGTNLHFLLS